MLLSTPVIGVIPVKMFCFLTGNDRIIKIIEVAQTHGLFLDVDVCPPFLCELAPRNSSNPSSGVFTSALVFVVVLLTNIPKI